MLKGPIYLRTDKACRGCAGIVIMTLLASIASFTSPLRGAVILYTPAGNIAGVSDVSTLGTLDRAYTFGASATTVNTVLFSVFPNASPDTKTFAVSPGNPYGSIFGTFAALPAAYKTLLSGGTYTDGAIGATAASITLNSLSIGTPYQVQIWVNDSQGAGGSLRTEFIDGQVIDYNTTDSVGDLGQYLIGTFVADATSQTFNFADSGNGPSGLGDVQVNALQLRVLPEPGSVGLLALGVAGFLSRRHARRA